MEDGEVVRHVPKGFHGVACTLEPDLPVVPERPSWCTPSAVHELNGAQDLAVGGECRYAIHGEGQRVMADCSGESR